MAARLPTPRYCIQHSRFTKQDGWRLKDLSLSLNGNIAVTGYNENTRRTYIDVYTHVRHSDSRDKPKIIYSKEFEKYQTEKGISWGRIISFFPVTGSDNTIFTCLGDKFEVIDLIQDRVIKSRKIKLVRYCWIQYLSIRETEIFISFMHSNKISVYDVVHLKEIKSIILQGIQDGYFPYHMTAITDRIFVSVGGGKEGSEQKSLIFEEKNGRILSELTKPTDTVQWYVLGLAMNITLNAIAVAWTQTFEGTPKGKDVIVFYSLLSENNCSFLIVEVEFGVRRIRISDRGDRMITGDRVTEECKVYDMSELFSYDHFKENLQSQLQEDDCLKLSEFFGLPDDQRDEISKSDTPTENLLLALEGKDVIQPSNVDRLAEAFTDLGIKSSCSHLVDFYQKTRLKSTPYGRFLATLSAHLTASLPADLCRYFDIPDDEKRSIISSPNPGLSLLLALDEIGIINSSEVEALQQPLSKLKLVQAGAKIHEYQLVIEEEKNQLQRQTDLTEAGKRELFIQCIQNKIQSWYETLTPVPWRKSCRWKSTDLFVGSGLVLTDSKAKRSLTDVDEECKLQYNQILNHNRLETEKRMILEGEPGSGKTMMSSQLAYDWSQGKISDVDVLLFLPLKFVNNVTLVEAMKRFYFSAYESISANDIESFLSNEDLHSCLILDGFEEYNGGGMTSAGEPSEVTKVMEKSRFPNCKVILTSRSDYAKDLPTCPMLKIGRLGEKERHTYIEKVFADDTEKQQKITRVIENNPFILDLCRVPLLFVLAVHNIESIIALQEAQLDSVAPFMENMVNKICTSTDSSNEGSVSELGVSNESLLEKFAFDGLCKGQQILSWQRNVLAASITNMKQFLDSGILVVEEGIIIENLRIIQDERAQDEFSQNKEKKERTKTKRIDQMNQIVQDGAGAMASSLHQGYYSASEGSNENVSSRQVPYATEEHISSKKRFWKRFKPKVFTKKKVLHSEGTTSKTSPSVKTRELSSFEKVQDERDPAAQECLVALTPAPGSVALKPESQSEQELSDPQKTTNSFTAKDYPLEVKFLHKVVQEWFASKHFASLLWESLHDNSLLALLHDVLPQISPIDLHYILRFTSYLCPPSSYLIMHFLSQIHSTVNGVIPEYIMNCICLCFAEYKQGNVPQMRDWDKTVMKKGMDLVVAKLCREAVIIRSDDSRITQHSKVAMLKYAASVGIPIKKVHLVDAVHVVDETSTTLTSGVTFDMFNMIEVLEMSRWDQHLEQKDYRSIVKLALRSNSIKKARLHFPSQPPDIDKGVFGDLVIYDKTVEWIIGPKLIQTFNMEAFKWEVTLQTADVHCTVLKQMSAGEVGAQVEKNYSAEQPEDLTIRAGDIITDITLVQNGWWEGEVSGKRGMFPCHHVKVVILNRSKPAARTRGVNGHVDTKQTDENTSEKTNLRAKVIVCYEPQEDDELSLEMNEQIEVTDQSQQWWWEGIANGKKGMFPSYYVMLLPEAQKTEKQYNETPVEVQVMYNYDAVAPEELTIKMGDTITDISEVEDGWWRGKVNGKEGLFPSHFVKVCTGTSEASAQNKIVLAKVVFNHTPQSDDELFLVEDDIIEITSQLDPLWWEGNVNGNQGRFPSYCVAPIQEDGKWSRQQDYPTPVRAQALYDYDAVEPDELTIKAGDSITDIHIGVGGWWEGMVKGKRGKFPSSFVEIHTEPPEQSAQNEKVLGKVTSSYSPQSDREVSFVEGGFLEKDLQKRYSLSYEEVTTFESGGPLPDIRDKTILSAENTVSNDGGLLQIENTDIKLIIPPNALGTNNTQCLVRMRVIPPGSHAAVPSSFSSHSSTVLELLPNNLRFQQPVELTLPHCLKLKKDAEYKAKIFMSHHEGDGEPRWEEVTDHHYVVRDTSCTLWLNNFCWTKYEIDNEIVEAKRIQVYTAAKPICVPDDIAVIEVGYHLDLPGAGEILRLNPSRIVGQRTPFLFLREGNHPLRVCLQKIRPPSWKYSTPEENPKEIPFRSVASSIEYSCPFLLEQETESCNIPTCIFKASQNQNHFELLIRPETIQTPTQPTSSHTTAEVHYQENITTSLDEDSKDLTESLCIKESTGAISSVPMAHDSLGKEPAVHRIKDEKDYVAREDTGAYQTLEPHLRSNQTCQREQTDGIHQRQLLQYSGLRPEMNRLLIQKYHYSQHFNMIPILAGTFGGLYGPHEPPWYRKSDEQEDNFINYSTLLSIARKLDTPDPLFNDWRMLAGKLGFTLEDIAIFQRDRSPTCSVITCALRRRKLTCPDHLKSILTIMNRTDAAECLPD